MMRNTLPPLASNDLFEAGVGKALLMSARFNSRASAKCPHETKPRTAETADNITAEETQTGGRFRAEELVVDKSKQQR